MNTNMQFSQKDLKGYSIRKALLCASGHEDIDAGLERELSKEMTRGNPGKIGVRGGLVIPWGVLLARDLTAGVANAGGYLVQTDNLAAAFIDALRPVSIVVKLGATVLPDLVGNVTVPKQSGTSTAYWLTTEATQVTESQPTLGQVALTPKTCGAYVEISRQLMLQSSPAAEAVAKNDVLAVVGTALDAAAINGSGVAGQPTGLLQTAGIGSVSGTSLAWAGVLEFESDVSGANALLNAALGGYATTPTVRALLKAREKAASSGLFLWEAAAEVGEGRVNGYRAVTSTNVPAATMIFGDWSQMMMGLWGPGIEFATNPYADFKAGITGARAFVTTDIGIRNAGAFSVATSIT